MDLNMQQIKLDILDGLAPIIKALIREVLYTVLKTFIENDPENAKLTIHSLYPVIDVKLQKFVENTANKIDDAVVDGVLESIEKIAKEFDFELPNLDED